MKLFLIEIYNGLDFPDHDSAYKLIAEKDIASASIKAVEFMNDSYETSEWGTPEFYVTEIKEVDGYNIKLLKQ